MSGGGENLPKITMFCFILSITVTLLTSSVLVFAEGGTPSDSLDDDVNTSIALFSGEEMVNYVGWTLDGVYTPGNYNRTDVSSGNNVWTEGDDVSGAWFYPGNLVDGKYVYPNGITSTTTAVTDKAPYDPVRLNAMQKSNIKLTYGSTVYEYESGLLHQLDPLDLFKTSTSTQNLYEWYFTGWRYQFTPTNVIEADGIITDKAKLNIVWYSNSDERYDESLEGGFLLYAEDDGFIVYTDSIKLGTILDRYTSSGSTVKYSFNFGGNTVYMFLQFDKGIETMMSYQEAFSRGYWSVQFASPISTYTTLGTGTYNTDVTVGSMISTMTSILTFQNDEIPSPFNILIWCLITIPATICVVLFSARIWEAFKIF